MPQIVDYDSATQINTILTRLGIPADTLANDLMALTDIIGNPSPADSVVDKLDTLQTTANGLSLAIGTPATSVSEEIADLQTDLTDVKTKTANLPTDPADQSAVESAINTAVTTLRGADNDTLKTLADAIETISTIALAMSAEIDKVPRVGETHRFIRVARDVDEHSADVAIEVTGS
jgi:hypothetical protein